LHPLQVLLLLQLLLLLLNSVSIGIGSTSIWLVSTIRTIASSCYWLLLLLLQRSVNSAIS
jgi:hypothetical protein